jgi:hypothetical protein
MRNGSDNHFRWLRPAQFKATVEGWRGWFPLVLAALAQACLPSRARGEDHADYRNEFYGEENGRIEINTHSFFFEKRLSESLALKGEADYDGISGATTPARSSVCRELHSGAGRTFIRTQDRTAYQGTTWVAKTIYHLRCRSS